MSVETAENQENIGMVATRSSVTDLPRRSGQDIAQWWHDRRSMIDEQVATGRYPALARIGLGEVDTKRGKDFEFGLQRILDGLEPLVGRTRNPSV